MVDVPFFRSESYTGYHLEDNDHQEPPSTVPDDHCPTAEDQQIKDVQPGDQDSPVSLSAGPSASHLLSQLDCDQIMRIEGVYCHKPKHNTHTLSSYNIILCVYSGGQND